MGVLADIKQAIDDSNDRVGCGKNPTEDAINAQAKWLVSLFRGNPDFKEYFYNALIFNQKPDKPFKAKVFDHIRRHINGSAFARAINKRKAPAKAEKLPATDFPEIQMSPQDSSDGPWGKLFIDGCPVAQLWFDPQALHIAMPRLRELGFTITTGNEHE